jgi:hypothetical protein
MDESPEYTDAPFESPEYTDAPVESLTPYPAPDYTEAPSTVPSSKVPVDEEEEEEEGEPTALTPSSELVKDEKLVEYDGPAKTGKTLKDLAMDLGAPDSLGTLIDEMQEALLGIVGDLVNSTTDRTSLADILGHENRLRGIGALCVLAALVGLVFDSVID